MNAIQQLATNKSGAASDSPAPGAATSAAEIENRFLTLLVSQLRNQDPMNPMDNAQLTTQLAQISTVSGIDKLNTTMASLAASLGASQYLQSSALVGHDVFVGGSQMTLAQGAAQGGFNLSQPADAVDVSIRDASGAVVRIEHLPAQPAGAGGFAWDGNTDAGAAAGNGNYTFEVTATRAGARVAADPLMVGHVTGVFAGAAGGSPQVQLGSLGRFDLSQVVEIN
jgi:flagellar basal-body rod modification protein FlgD